MFTLLNSDYANIWWLNYYQYSMKYWHIYWHMFLSVWTSEVSCILNVSISNETGRHKYPKYCDSSYHRVLIVPQGNLIHLARLFIVLISQTFVNKHIYLQSKISPNIDTIHIFILILWCCAALRIVML